MKLQALLATALLSAAPAEATTYIITYTGIVSGGSASSNLFAAQNLTGKTYTAVYTLTAPLLGARTFDNGTIALIEGGASISRPSPISALLTIENQSFQLLGDQFGTAFYQNAFDGSGNPDNIWHVSNFSSEILDSGIFNRISSNVNNIISSHDYTSDMTYFVQAGDYASGSFYYRDRDGNRFADVSFLPNSVTIARGPTSSAVPEPATWALLIAGFGMVGGAMRRQQQRVRLRYV